MVTVPQRFPCRDEAECQKTGLFPAPFAEQHCPDAVARAWWLQIHCRPGRVFENWLLKKNQEAVEWMQEENASFSLCCWDPEEERSILVAAVRELQCPWSTLHMVRFTEALQWKGT